jgi:hypothetical protein
MKAAREGMHARLADIARRRQVGGAENARLLRHRGEK